MPSNSISKRKSKVIFQRLFFSFGIFLFALFLCVILFGWQYIVGVNILSPIGLHGLNSSTNTDGMVYTVKSFCQEKKLPCQSITNDNNAVTITLDNSAVILLSSQKDLQKQLASLQLTLSQLTIEGKQFKKLDFRFDKPFVTF